MASFWGGLQIETAMIANVVTIALDSLQGTTQTQAPSHATAAAPEEEKQGFGTTPLLHTPGCPTADLANGAGSPEKHVLHRSMNPGTSFSEIQRWDDKEHDFYPPGCQVRTERLSWEREPVSFGRGQRDGSSSLSSQRERAVGGTGLNVTPVPGECDPSLGI